MPVTYKAIATTTLGSATATVTFSSIPQTYTDLILVTNIQATTGSIFPYITFNSDTGANYSYTWISGRSTDAAVVGRNTNLNFIYLPAYAGADTANLNFNSITHIQSYSNSTTYKTAISRCNNASTSNVDASVGLWRNTSAITTLVVGADTSTFASGSTFTIYGIKGA